MLHLKDYVWNCYEMCRNTKNNKPPYKAHDLGVAFDMLRCNIENGYEMYPGTDLPWAVLKRLWDAMTPDEQKQSRNEWHMCDQFPGGREAFADGDRAKFEELKAAKFQEELAKLTEDEEETE